jgi:hypothetical protein
MISAVSSAISESTLISAGGSRRAQRSQVSRAVSTITGTISASRLQRLGQLLHVPVGFFFEGAPQALGLPSSAGPGAETPSYVSDFLAIGGIALAEAFMRIPDARLRQAIVALVHSDRGLHHGGDVGFAVW